MGVVSRKVGVVRQPFFFWFLFLTNPVRNPASPVNLGQLVLPNFLPMHFTEVLGF